MAAGGSLVAAHARTLGEDPRKIEPSSSEMLAAITPAPLQAST